MNCWRTIATSFAICLASANAYATHVIVEVPPATPADAAIYLAGSTPALGPWLADALKLARQPDGTFAGDVDGPAEFKVTRGTWATVEKLTDGGELPNRRLEAGVAELRVTVARWTEASAATSRPSTVVGDLRIEQVAGRTIRVWLPPGYAASDARYPVLYLHDGQNCFDAATSAFGTEWQVDESLKWMIEAGQIPPIIAVGIDNTDRRIDEYTVTKDRGRGGAGEAYLAFVLDVVRPHVESTYHASGDAYIGGSSLGGLISLEMIERHAGRFAGAMLMSPSLWWDGESATTRAASMQPGPRVWLDMGGREGDEPAAEVERARRLDVKLGKAGVEHRLTIDDAGGHNEAAWARRFPEAIRYLLSPATTRPTTNP